MTGLIMFTANKVSKQDEISCNLTWDVFFSDEELEDKRPAANNSNEEIFRGKYFFKIEFVKNLLI